MLTVDPGQYRVILSMADSEGRVGSVSRAVTAFQMDGPGLSMGDLLLGGYARRRQRGAGTGDRTHRCRARWRR